MFQAIKLRNFAIIVLLTILTFNSWAQSPKGIADSAPWMAYNNPEDAGWSPEKLKTIEHDLNELESSSLLIVQNGRIVKAWGATNEPLKTYSVRKSLMSLLYGMAWKDRTISLQQSLSDLHIEDLMPLSQNEQSATVHDLLNSTSGIYHPAAKEPPSLDNRPVRDTHKPGEKWWYNNWGFNASLSILEQQTQRSFVEMFMAQLAKPLGMEDLTAQHIHYVYEPNKSHHGAYEFYMSARDLARIGQLLLQQGKWNDEQIIDPEWLALSTTSQWQFNDDAGYGYMWWINPALSDYFIAKTEAGKLSQFQHIVAAGSYGQMLMILPQIDVVIVHRGYPRERGVSEADTFRLIASVLDAKKGAPIADASVAPFQFNHRATINAQHYLNLTPPTQQEIEQVVGDYYFGERGHIRVYEWRKMLFTTGPMPGQSHLQLLKNADGWFTSRELPVEIEFITNTDTSSTNKSSITSMSLSFNNRNIRAHKQ